MQALGEVNFLLWIIIPILILFAVGAIILYTKRKPLYPVFVPDPNTPYTEEQIAHSVFLVGDMGALPTNREDYVAANLKAQLKEAGKKGTLIFLGDNVYPRGLYEENHPKRKLAEGRLKAQLDIMKAHIGRSIMLSGNHDWNRGRRGGWEYVLRQEKYVKEYLGRDDVYLPKNGCPGPVSLTLADNVQLIILNTQWWPQEGGKPIGKEHNCTVETKEQFFAQVKILLEEYKGKKILIAAHHPLYSYSIHGGKFGYKHHLFPLRDLNKKLYLPLPLVGSLYPLYRKVYGAKEDIAHPSFRKLRGKLLGILNTHRGIVYAAGHDHSLQHIEKRGNHFLVSGAGSKTAFVRNGTYSHFTKSQRGFLRINYLTDGRAYLEAWLPQKDGSAERAYMRELE